MSYCNPYLYIFVLFVVIDRKKSWISIYPEKTTAPYREIGVLWRSVLPILHVPGGSLSMSFAPPLFKLFNVQWSTINVDFGRYILVRHELWRANRKRKYTLLFSESSLSILFYIGGTVNHKIPIYNRNQL